MATFAGGTVVLVFYPSDFSPVCTDQLSVYQEVLPQFEERGTTLLGISVDGAFCHKAFQQQLNTTIPLLADFHPKGEVAKSYGVWSDKYGVAETRARDGRPGRRGPVVLLLAAARGAGGEPDL